MHGRAPGGRDRASTCAHTTGLDKARSLGAMCEGGMTSVRQLDAPTKVGPCQGSSVDPRHAWVAMQTHGPS
ncbi:hypothetical protein DD607_36145, partial [Salmonella sp. 3DZ2-4SM]